MKWRGRRRSSNIEDTRGSGAPRRGGLRLGGGKLGGGKIGGIGIVVVVVMVLMGGDPSQLLGALLGGGGGTSVSTGPGASTAPQRAPGPVGNDAGAEFVAVVLGDTETTWGKLFQASGQQYPEPKLRLFSDSVDSACGYNTAATGPFYCPPDQRVYLDLSFFRQLEQLGAPGDFAQAYVIGHEVGHHVQNVTGVLSAVQNRKRRASEVDANALQVLVELQADCYAGVWGHHAARNDLLERGDIEEGLQAASSIGDDHLQKRAGRRVSPESFTHGSSAQRMKWFRAGLDSGEVGRCDTFAEAGVRL